MNLKGAVYNKLIADSTLTGMLAVNPHAIDQNISPSKLNSIIDAIHVDRMKQAPFISLQGGDINMRAGAMHTADAFIYVRCYNNRDDTFYTINQVQSRVRQLLDGQRFTIEGYASVETVFETERSEQLDEAVNLNFREAQYRSQII